MSENLLKDIRKLAEAWSDGSLPERTCELEVFGREVAKCVIKHIAQDEPYHLLLIGDL